MSILVLTSDTKEKGGVGNYYNCLKLNLEKDIDYFFVNNAGTTSIMHPGNISKWENIQKTISLLSKYLKFIFMAPRYKLIHINPSLTPHSFYRDLIFILLSKLYRKNILIFFRGWDENFEDKISHSGFLSYLFKKTFGSVDRIIVLGKVFENKLLQMGARPSKNIILESTVADTTFMEGFSIDEKITSYDDCVKFLFIARILRSKGIYIAIDAFVEAQRILTNRSMKLYIAGEGEELNDAKSYVQNNKFNNIYFVGDARNDVKKTLLHNCHIMLFPTYHGEGMPNCILEGMLYGMPIISRINAGIPDVVGHQINGLLTNSIDSAEFSRFCINLASDKQLYKKMAKINLFHAIESFSTEKVRKRILKLYNEARF